MANPLLPCEAPRSGLKIDRIEVDNPRSLPEVLLLRRPSIVVMAVIASRRDPLQILGILATHNLYPSILLIGPGYPAWCVRRAAESRGFPVIGVRHRPLAATMLEQVPSPTPPQLTLQEDELLAFSRNSHCSTSP